MATRIALATSILGCVFMSTVGLCLADNNAYSTGNPNATWPDIKFYDGGEMNTFYTTWEKGVEYLIGERQYFIFGVKSCSSVVLALTGITVVGKDAHQTDISIGLDDNTRTDIYHGGNVILSQLTPQILHCQAFRTFWIRWGLTSLEFGRGRILGRNTVLSAANIQSMGRIKMIYFRSLLSEVNAVWQIRENSANEIIMVTSPIYGYERFWKSVQEKNFFNFRVMACSDVYIVLTSAPGFLQDKVYEIVIGGQNNTISEIRRQAGVSEGSLVTLNQPGLLDCNVNREFWIGWLNQPIATGTIQVGQGHIYGERVLMKAVEPNIRNIVNIRHLSVSTGSDNFGSWVMNDDLGATTTFITRVNTDASIQERYKHVWLISPFKHLMTFSITAATNVYIHLSTQETGVDTEFGVELIIRSGGGARTELRQMIGEVMANASTPNILGGQEVRQFWLSWTDGYIRFGKGDIDDAVIVLQAEAPSADYKGLSFSSVGTRATWRIKEEAGSRLLISEGPQPSIEMMNPSAWRSVQAQERISFLTQTCSNTTFVLSPTVGIDELSFYYLVHLSFIDNTNSTILRCDAIFNCEVLAAMNFGKDTFTCGNIQELYVTWYEKKIVIGHGAFPTLFSGLLEADDLSIVHHVNAIGMVDSDAKTEGWGFRQGVGDQFIYHTSGLEGYNLQVWQTVRPGRTNIMFDIRAASDARVRLVSVSGSQYVDITICGWNNSFTTIINNEGTIGANETTKGFLDRRTPRPFLISWDNNLIQVTGGDPLLASTGMVVSWQNTKPFNISTIALSTVNGHSGVWTFHQDMGSMTTFQSCRDDWTWREVEYSSYIVYSVRAKQDMRILLSEQLGVVSSNALEVALGHGNNSVSFIRPYSSDQDWLQKVTENILDEKTFKDFWISWSPGEVQLGEGSTPGEDSFIQYQLILNVNFRAVAFYSGKDSGDAEWKMPMNNFS